MKTDIRIIKTQRAIEKAFIELVEINGYKNVTLVDVAKRAEVNRNTIYLHYDSKEGLVESIIKNAVQSQIKDFDLLQYIKLKNNRKKIENMYKVIFTIFDNNIELYRIFLTDENLVGFLYSEIAKLKKTVLAAFKPTIKNELTIDFVLNGIFGVLSNYTVYAKGTVDENVKMLTDFTIVNLRKLTYQL